MNVAALLPIEAELEAAGCRLVRRRLPGIPFACTLCHAAAGATQASAAERLAAQQLMLAQVPRLAQAVAGDPEAYVLLHSGRAVRKRANEHLHVFVVSSRGQKAWLYSLLALRQTGEALRQR